MSKNSEKPSPRKLVPNRGWNPGPLLDRRACYRLLDSGGLHAGAPGIFSDLLRCVQKLKREWGAVRNRKVQQLSIPSKSATWFPEFAVKDLPSSRTAALVPEFAVRDLPLSRIL